jgi:hypothetical protein
MGNIMNSDNCGQLERKPDETPGTHKFNKAFTLTYEEAFKRIYFNASK